MLYYAPQAWTSDDTDAAERLKIQYGTSFAYPISSMGAHVSASPNHQLFRKTSMEIRGNVAYFGAFGYELDLTRLTLEERGIVRRQIAFVKKYRGLLHKGTFWRLKSPFEGNIVAWMVVSADKKQAIVGYYKILNEVNGPFRRLKLQGLDESFCYRLTEVGGEADAACSTLFFGSELMNVGMVTSDASAGEQNSQNHCTDFWSRVIVLEAE